MENTYAKSAGKNSHKLWRHKKNTAIYQWQTLTHIVFFLSSRPYKLLPNNLVPQQQTNRRKIAKHLQKNFENVQLFAF